jgi:hypothetical protein
LPRTAPPPARDRAIGAEIAEGFRFLAQSPVLRPIALCALLWNAAFFAFVAVYVPFTLARVTSDPALVGLGQAGYGAGLILGAATAATILHRLGAAPVLLGGPALSVAAPLALLAAAHGGGVAPSRSDSEAHLRRSRGGAFRRRMANVSLRPPLLCTQEMGSLCAAAERIAQAQGVWISRVSAVPTPRAARGQPHKRPWRTVRTL